MTKTARAGLANHVLPILAMLLAFVAHPAAAQTGNDDLTVRPVNIEAGNLKSSLFAVARLFDVNVIAPDALVVGKKSPPVNGRMTAQSAIRALLNGSGLSFERSASGAYVLANVNSTDELPPPQNSSGNTTSIEPAVIEEVLVYGTKRGLSIQGTQASVALFTEDMIEEQVIIDVEDILLRTPNVSTEGNGALTALSIRGVGLVGVGNAGTGITSNVYVDNAPSSRAANQGAANLWDVEQVEILRGPQSTIQGRNALAGALIIRTADPEYDYDAKARVKVGNEDNRQYSVAFTGPIVTDQLAFRLAADYREVDFDVVDVPTERPTRFQEALTLRGKLLFEPEAVPGLRVKATGSYVEAEFGEFNVATAPVSATAPAFSDFDRFGNETFAGSGRINTVEVQQGIIDAGYTLDDRWSFVLIGTIEDSFRNTNTPLGGSDSEFELYSGEIRAVFDYERFRGWIGGYYYSEEESGTIKFSSPAPFPTNPPNGAIILDSDQFVDTENYALFADITFDIDERWSINLGVRQDWESFSDTGLTSAATSNPADCVFDASVPVFGGLPCAAIFPSSSEPSREADFNAFLPRGSITYAFDDWRSVSFGIQRGYRAGGSFVFALAGEPIETFEFDAEFITNYEIAFRSQWLDEKLTVNANVYFADWTDQQVTIDELTPSPFDVRTINAGESELYGAEVTLAGEVHESFEVFASLGISKTEFTDFPFAAASVDPQFVNLAGNQFNTAPEFTGSLGFSFLHPSGFFTSWNVAYTDEQFSDIANLAENKTDSYALVNARAGYRFGHFEISLFANNLLDERVATRKNLFRVNNTTGVVTPTARGAFVVNDPRLFGVALTVRL